MRPRSSGGKPTAPPGDLVKTAEIVGQERVRTPDLRATLILTTNQEPDEALVRAVTAGGAAHQIEVDIWSRSRLSHVLDTYPTGRWIRACARRKKRAGAPPGEGHGGRAPDEAGKLIDRIERATLAS